MGKKDILRRHFLNFRRNLPYIDVVNVSKKIMESYFKLVEVKRGQKFMAFFSYRNEIITHEIIKVLLQQDKKVYLPYVVRTNKELKISPISNIDDDLVIGSYGIKEPKNKADSLISDLDVILVPGLAFTRDGYRLGYGGGYYDRFIKRLSPKTRTIGLVYHDLLVDSLPVEEYDLPVDIIITEKEIIYVGGDGY